jgi:hypothetical protein
MVVAPGDGVVRVSRQQALVIDPQKAVAEGGSRVNRIALNCYTIR